MMSSEEFELVAQETYDALPTVFRTTIDNVRIVVEDRPGAEGPGWKRGGLLLGLYQGVPLNKRGVDYGIYPVVPDTITLYKHNIEQVARTEGEVRDRIREVLIHEIGHYYGMTEEEIRRAGY